MQTDRGIPSWSPQEKSEVSVDKVAANNPSIPALGKPAHPHHLTTGSSPNLPPLSSPVKPIEPLTSLPNELTPTQGPIDLPTSLPQTTSPMPSSVDGLPLPPKPTYDGPFQSTALTQDGLQLEQVGRTFQPWEWLTYWQFWGATMILIFAGLGGLATLNLLRLPAVANCPAIFLPTASASTRLACAEAAAGKNTVNGYLEAIKLVQGLPPEHPLRSELDRSIRQWVEGLLALGENAFQDGKLNDAIVIARRIPGNLPGQDLVDQRIERWRKIWEEAESIFRSAEASLRKRDWGQAYTAAGRLTFVENRYWATVKYQELTDKILTARQGGNKLERARNLMAEGGFQNLVKALELLNAIEKGNSLYEEAQIEIRTIGKKLLDLAETALKNQDYNQAMAIVRKIPTSAELQQEVADFTILAKAQSKAWQGTISDLEDAISQVQQIGIERPFYGRAQRLITRWQLEIEAVSQLEQAKNIASAGDADSLAKAIAQAQKIASGNPRWQEAQSSIKTWRAKLQIQEDQPIIDAAEALVISGNIGSLQAAIDQASRISPDRASYNTAQEKIQDWNRQIQEIQDRPLLDRAWELANQGQVQEAISIAQLIQPGRALYGDAQQGIETWRNQNKGRQNLDEARRLANVGNASSLTRAIQVAGEVPESSTSYLEAIDAINRWSREILVIANSQSVTDPAAAIALAQQIPPRTEAYAEAQLRIKTWQEQLAGRP